MTILVVMTVMIIKIKIMLRKWIRSLNNVSEREIDMQFKIMSVFVDDFKYRKT